MTQTPVKVLEEKSLAAVQVMPEQLYESLVDDLKDLITERVWNIRHDRIKMMWDIGDLIVTECEKSGMKNYSAIVKELEKDVGINFSQLYRAVKFKEKFNTWQTAMDLLPDGKNISWKKICEKILPEIPEAKLGLKSGEREMIDKFGINVWWEKQPEKGFTLILKDPKTSVVLKIVEVKGQGIELQTPLVKLLENLREYYVKLKGWNPKDLDHQDYARIHASLKRLILKSRGDEEAIKRAIDWVEKQQYPEWSIETVEKKYAEASKPVNKYAKYMKQEKKKW